MRLWYKGLHYWVSSTTAVWELCLPRWWHMFHSLGAFKCSPHSCNSVLSPSMYCLAHTCLWELLYFYTSILHASVLLLSYHTETEKFNKITMLTGLEVCSLLTPIQLFQKYFWLKASSSRKKKPYQRVQSQRRICGRKTFYQSPHPHTTEVLSHRQIYPIKGKSYVSETRRGANQQMQSSLPKPDS